jgi:tetratricopeptide (TPR) repeat protein
METIDSAFPDFQPAVLISKQRVDRLLAPLCAVAAFAFYWTLTPACLPPGAPAELTATAMGLPAQNPPFHLIWRALAAGMTAIPYGTMTAKLALLSALLSALATAMVYQVSIELLMHRLIPNGTNIDRLKVCAVHLGGLTAAMAFAAASPVVLAASRASLRCLDVVLLLVGTRLFLRYYDGGSVLNLVFSALVCGLGMGENPGCCVVFAAILLAGIFLLWRQDRSTLPMLAFAGLALLLLLLIYPAVGYMWHVPGGGVGSLLGGHFSEVLQDYAASRTGMLVGSLSLLPLILALATMNQTLNYGEDYESLLTLSALAVASLLVLTNAFTSFRVFALLNPDPPVLPYLCAAMTAGFVAAGWWTVAISPSQPSEDVDDLDRHHPGTPHVVKGFGYGVVITLSVAILFAGLLTYKAIRGRPDWYPQRCAETILSELGARHWLFGHTPANTHLAVLARDRQQPLHVLPLTADGTWSPQFRDRIGRALQQDEALSGLDRVQLAEALALGPDVLLRTWLLADRHAHEKLAIAGPPMLWESCGFTPVPSLFFFGGSSRPCPVPPPFAERLLQAERTRQRAGSSWLVDETMTRILTGADVAFSASAAYAIGTYRASGDAPAASRLAATWNLPRTTTPSYRVFAAPLTWIWEATVLPGRPERSDILHTIREEERLLAQELKDDPAGRRTAGGLTRALYTPGDLTELYSLARGSADMAMVNQTFSWIAQLEQNGAPGLELLLLRAESHMALTGTVDQAVALLQEAVARRPHDLWAWHLLVASQLQRGNAEAVERETLPAMERAAGGETNLFVQLSRALVLGSRGGSSARTARDLFATAADAHPDLPIAREWALRLDMLLHDDAAASRDAGILVASDEDHPQANYQLAHAALRNRQFAEAERRLRQSLTGTMTPQAMVARARLYCQWRMYTEAMQIARKATSEWPDYADGWSVLGDALEATGKPGEAAVVRSRAAGAPEAAP